MRDVDSSFRTYVFPILGALQLVDSVEGLKFSIKGTHRKLFYCKMVTHIQVFFFIGIIA